MTKILQNLGVCPAKFLEGLVSMRPSPDNMQVASVQKIGSF